MPEGDTPSVGDDPKAGASSGPVEGSPAKGKTFTQEDVDRINAETRRKAEDASTKRLLQSLGIEDEAQGKEIIKAAKAAEEASKSELQRVQEENSRLQAKALEAEAKARSTLALSKIENAMRDAGINPQRVAHALRLADLGDVKVADDGTVAGVEDVVKAVKDASPEWFGAPGQAFSAPDASGGAPSSDIDYRTASPEQRKKMLAKFNVKPSPLGLKSF